MPEHVEPARSAHPVLFLILFLPLGITSGYVTVTLAYLLVHAGASVTAVAGLVALSLFPQTWKVVWAPIVDATLSNKSWYFISAIITGALMLATAVIPPTLANFGLIEILVLLFNITMSFNCMAADALMAHATPMDEKGRAGGWSQAGNLGGAGLGGGAGLWLAQHVTNIWTSGAVLGGVCILSSLAVLFLDEPPFAHRGANLAQGLRNIVREVWSIIRQRSGLLVIVLMTLPIGAGAAANLWSAVAGDWQASADLVALVTGVLSGLLSMLGCLAGGYLSDLMDRRTAYAVFGVLLALCAMGMAVAPHTPAMFVVWTSVYSVVLGFCYAGFGAVTLEAIGAGAVATKYNLIASISNIPIAYQTLIDGWGHKRWGSNGMLWVEAACGIAAVVFFALLAAAARRPLQFSIGAQAPGAGRGA
ncbi:MAG TPA: MFS transporter [Rhizomicrobium sp.]|nr:MFS transporter [Rhizomicrobium sp.]